MKTYIKYGIAALAGAAVGAVAAWKIYDHRINQLLQECTDEEKSDVVSEDTEGVDESTENERGVAEYESLRTQDDPISEKPATFDEYVNMVSTKYHTTENKIEKKGEEPEESEAYYPEIISPDEFCDDDSYRTVYWTLYADDVMADDYGNKIQNFKNILGEGVLSSFGTYDPKTVHAKDVISKCYYEIIKEDFTYASIYGRL